MPRAARRSRPAARSSCDGGAPRRRDTRGSDFEQPFQIGAGLRLVLEAGGKLRQQRAQLVRFARAARSRRGTRRRPCCPSLDGSPAGRFREHVRVRELLIQLQRELEIRRRPLRPFLHRRDRGHAIKRRVHLDGVEVLGVKGELVELGRAARAARRLGGIEDAVPGAFAGGIAPAGRPDADVGLAGRSCGAHCARYSSFLNPKTTFVAAHQYRPLDQVRLFHHQVDGFLLGPRQLRAA